MQNTQYRLLDETTKLKEKPPWNPLSLFFITAIFGPLGGIFFSLNWERLGEPNRKWQSLGIVALALVLPILSITLLHYTGYKIEPSSARLIKTLVKFALAYYFLNAQRPLFANHIENGGQKGNILILWVAFIALASLFAWFGYSKLPPEKLKRSHSYNLYQTHINKYY